MFVLLSLSCNVVWEVVVQIFNLVHDCRCMNGGLDVCSYLYNGTRVGKPVCQCKQQYSGQYCQYTSSTIQDTGSTKEGTVQQSDTTVQLNSNTVELYSSTVDLYSDDPTTKFSIQEPEFISLLDSQSTLID